MRLVFKERPLDYDPAYRNNPQVSIHTVCYQPEGRYYRHGDNWYRVPFDRTVPEDLLTKAESHSDYCDCLYCKRMRVSRGWTPRWWRGLIEEGRIPLDHIEVNPYPFNDGTWGTGDKVCHRFEAAEVHDPEPEVRERQRDRWDELFEERG